MDQQGLKDLRIVIIDESDVIKKALTGALAKSEGCHVVGIAGKPDEGLQLVIGEQPHVVLMDISSPEPRVELLRNIRKVDQAVIVIVFTADSCSKMRTACRQAGAAFYLIKWQVRDLLDLLRLVRRLT